MERVKKESNKERLYIGQLITSENYNDFTQPKRLFWQKCFKAFRAGKTFFTHKGQQFVVPFRLADDSFNSIITKDKYDNLLDPIDKTKVDELNNTGDTESLSPDTVA